MNDPMARLENAVQRDRQELEGGRALAAARIKMVLGRDAKSVFFATLALRLEARPDWDLETACVDGKRLSYNPGWLLALNDEERVAVVAHEVMHLALQHHTRRGARDANTWSIACDLAINPLLTEAGYKVPSCGLVPGRGQYAKFPPGLSAEDYYSRLQEKGDNQDQGDEEQPGQEPGQGKGVPDPGGCGGVTEPGGGTDPARIKEGEADWKEFVAQAQQLAKARGNLPGGIARLIEELLAPSVDWREVLREFVSRFAKNDYSWAQPNRRMMCQGYYLPGMRSEELGDVVVAVDTSGSIGQKELTAFASEMQGILDGFDVSLTILYHDSQVAGVQQWKSSDGPLVLEPKGGGGTSHIPVFEHIGSMDDQPTCLVCLTDLMSSFPRSAPEYPVLWATTEPGSKGPFGQTVEIRV